MILSKKPLIILTHWYLIPLDILSGKTKSYLFFIPGWNLEEWLSVNKENLENFIINNRYTELIFIVNNEYECKIAQEKGYNYVYCNQNALIDENIFTIIKGSVKRFDTVYNAIIKPYKNHLLCKKLENIAFITYFNGDEGKYFQHIKENIPQAKLLNFINGKYRGLSPKEITGFLNQGRVGLCLSVNEGAMFASIEYLLCGLSIVSLESTGGRDVFFDKEYVEIAKNDTVSVAEKVELLIRRKVDPEFIRNKTIEKMNSHRVRFIEKIQSIYDAEGVKRDFAQEWDKLFINKLASPIELYFYGKMFRLRIFWKNFIRSFNS